VDTFYLRRDISPSDAKTIILETIIAFKFIFPLANVMEVKFVGIKDNSMDGDETVRRKELRNKKSGRKLMSVTTRCSTVRLQLILKLVTRVTVKIMKDFSASILSSWYWPLLRNVK